MHVTASDKDAPYYRVHYWTGEKMETLGNATAFNTDEKWVEIFVLGPGNKCLVVNGELLRARLFIDYWVRDRRTDTVIRPDGTTITSHTRDNWLHEAP